MKGKPVSILWVARMRFLKDLRIREVELARGLASRADIVALDRSETAGWGESSTLSKLRLRWQMARGGWASWTENSIRHFRMPVVVGTGPVTNRAAAWINERRIGMALDRFQCTMVFHSNPFLFLPPPAAGRRYRVHFDLVDNFFDGWKDSLVGRSRKRFLKDAVLRADSLSAISHSLCDRMEEFAGRRPAYVPNGAAVDEIERWPVARVQEARARHRLEGKTALAYIGNHVDEFDGTEMLVEAFQAARRHRPDLELLLVGPGSERVPRARGLGLAEGVHVVGPVPTTEVWDYFHAADLGLLPFILEPGTHDCLPLKVLEFAAAGKPMLATPLRELIRLDLPHMRFAPYDSAAWSSALQDPATYAHPDRGALKAAMRPFSWQAASEALARVMGLPTEPA
ncbi:MAG: glycosyltransferase family 4 protein [Candidatus Polarisedimenticolia bacterium]